MELISYDSAVESIMCDEIRTHHDLAFMTGMLDIFHNYCYFYCGIV
jgi:hypothetical protein